MLEEKKNTSMLYNETLPPLQKKSKSYVWPWGLSTVYGPLVRQESFWVQTRNKPLSVVLNKNQIIK